MSSHKTIDGRGQRIKLTGKGLRLKECENIIICNLEFEGGRGHDVDGIQIKPNSRNIWIDRCSLRDYDDGLIDITRQSTDITVSRLAIWHKTRNLITVHFQMMRLCAWTGDANQFFLYRARCHFSHHDKTMLIGADPSHTMDRCIRVTIHHCFFDGTRQRHPRVRFGKVHLYNNYTRNWGIYAVCASVESQVRVPGFQIKIVFAVLSKMQLFPPLLVSLVISDFLAMQCIWSGTKEKNIWVLHWEGNVICIVL